MKARTVYRVRAGSLTRFYDTEYHAGQLARALRLHGMTAVVDAVKLPDDPLTRIVTHTDATFKVGPL